MMKFARIGAAAMAMALSITMIAPLSAKAEVITEYEYKDGEREVKSIRNEDTKESLSNTEYDSISAADVTKKFPKAYTIATNTYGNRLTLSTPKDTAKFTDFKANKKALKVKVVYTYEYADPTKYEATDKGSSDYTSKDGKTFYYRNIEDKIVSTTDETKLPKGGSYGYYTIRFFTKKAGTYKLKFNAVLKDGSTVKKTIKVIAKADGSPFKSITFAGKTIAQSKDADAASTNDLWAKGYGHFTTTAKKGVIRVNMNPDFKLKKIEVGTPDIKTVPGENSYNVIYRDDYTSSLDEVNETDLNSQAWTGEKDKTVICKWKKVKNGKKIKLSKVDTSVLGWHTTNSAYTDKRKAATTQTYVRITYYDKKNKETGRTVIQINRVNK